MEDFLQAQALSMEIRRFSRYASEPCPSLELLLAFLRPCVGKDPEIALNCPPRPREQKQGLGFRHLRRDSAARRHSLPAQDQHLQQSLHNSNFEMKDWTNRLSISRSAVLEDMKPRTL